MNNQGKKKLLDILVGKALKIERKAAQLTLSELSKKSGVSTAMISKIERGQVSASLNTLDLLSRAIGVPVINFFAQTVERHDVSFVRSGEGISVSRRGSTYGHNYKLIGRIDADPIKFESFMITLDETANGQPVFQHPGVEFIYVLCGRMSYQCGEETYQLSDGDCLTFETQAPHGPVKLHTAEVVFFNRNR